MIDKKYMEYINKAVDKTINEKEQNELIKYLSENKEAEKYYRELIKLSEVMTQVKDVEPPEDLKQNIINAIPKNRYAVSRKSNPLHKFADIIKGREKPHFAYSFSAGLAVGVAVVVLCFYGFYSDSNLNRSHLSGSLFFQENMTGLTTVVKKDFMLGNTGVGVVIKSSDESLLADMIITSPSLINCTVEYETDEISFHSFYPQDKWPGIFYSNYNCIEFNHEGENRYLLLFRKETETISPLKITVEYDGNIYEDIIVIDKTGN